MRIYMHRRGILAKVYTYICI